MFIRTVLFVKIEVNGKFTPNSIANCYKISDLMTIISQSLATKYIRHFNFFFIFVKLTGEDMDLFDHLFLDPNFDASASTSYKEHVWVICYTLYKQVAREQWKQVRQDTELCVDSLSFKFKNVEFVQQRSGFHTNCIYS